MPVSSACEMSVASDSKKLEGHQVAAGGENQVITLFEVTDGALVPKVNHSPVVHLIYHCFSFMCNIALHSESFFKLGFMKPGRSSKDSDLYG